MKEDFLDTSQCHNLNRVKDWKDKRFLVIPPMTTPALLLNSNDLENTFLRDNARKKSYVEILQEDNMQDFPLEAENSDTEDQLH